MGRGHRPSAVDSVNVHVERVHLGIQWGTYGESIEVSRLQRGFGHLPAQRLVFQRLVQMTRVLLLLTVVRGVVVIGWVLESLEMG